MKVSLAVLAIISAAVTIRADYPPQQADRIAFVYEAVRHGARAPLMDEGPDSPFRVPAQELTAQGMRQRYLLGRRNR
jgi:hypothetical protein